MTCTASFVALTPFAGRVRTLIWGSLYVMAPYTIVAGGDTECDPA